MKKITLLLFFLIAGFVFATKPISNQIETQSISLNNNLETKTEQQIIEKNEHFNRLVNLLSVAIVVILSLLSLSLFKNYKIEYTNNRLLKQKNEELQKEKERSEKAIKEKNDFLATISHEIKTPLNSINLLSEILLEENLNGNQKENLVSLKISSNYLMNLINDVLQINKMEAPYFKIEEVEFNIIEKIENISKSLFEIAKQNNVTCKTNIDPSIPERLIGDETKLTQILINLISNAIKFSKNGIVETNLKLIANNNDELKIRFEVIDNGIGIPEEQQQLIFENFTQGSPEISKQFGGTGLGLTIVKKLVESLGSFINLKSNENEGSNFNFELSFKNHFTSLKIYDELNYKIIENKAFLIVEDNSITKVVTQKLIEKYKGNCTIASTGKEALEITKNSHFDLIIMDINLPDINGDDVSKKIRKHNIKTPILAFTAIFREDFVKNIKSKDINDFITKPVDIKIFYQKIINLLEV